jgi:hypothetical protein
MRSFFFAADAAAIAAAPPPTPAAAAASCWLGSAAAWFRCCFSLYVEVPVTALAAVPFAAASCGCCWCWPCEKTVWHGIPCTRYRLSSKNICKNTHARIIRTQYRRATMIFSKISKFKFLAKKQIMVMMTMVDACLPGIQHLPYWTSARNLL